MNSVSFNGIYRIQTTSVKKDKHETIENKLNDEFKAKNIEFYIWADSYPAESGFYRAETHIISYGAPEQDYEVLQNVFGENLIQPEVLTESQKRFGKDYMKSFKSAVQQFIDKRIKDLDTDIENAEERNKLREKLLATQDKAGFVTDEFCENALDIG